MTPRTRFRKTACRPGINPVHGQAKHWLVGERFHRQNCAGFKLLNIARESRAGVRYGTGLVADYRKTLRPFRETVRDGVGFGAGFLDSLQRRFQVEMIETLFRQPTGKSGGLLAHPNPRKIILAKLRQISPDQEGRLHIL